MEDNQQSNYILTADIGGSHITAGLCCMGPLGLIDEKTVRAGVQSKGAANNILTSWRTVLQQVISKSGGIAVSGIGIAMPGPFDYQKGISYIRGLNKYEALYGMDIREYLAGALGLSPSMVRFRNDAESTIAGESLMGEGKNFERVLGITLGTGFGSAFSDKNNTTDLNLGSDAFKASIADDYFSTRWFLKRYFELTGLSLSGGVKELADLAGNSSLARGIFREFAMGMGEFLLPHIERLAPDALVICGNIARAHELFMPHLERLLNPLPVKIGSLNENAPLIGAAFMFREMLVAF